MLKNPIEKNATSFNVLMAEVTMGNTKLARFCKTKVTESNKLDAVLLKKYQWEKSEEARKEKERLEKEEEERLAAENN